VGALLVIDVLYTRAYINSRVFLKRKREMQPGSGTFEDGRIGLQIFDPAHSCRARSSRLSEHFTMKEQELRAYRRLYETHWKLLANIVLMHRYDVTSFKEMRFVLLAGLEFPSNVRTYYCTKKIRKLFEVVFTYKVLNATGTESNAG
jgi:hypothetical protein